MTDPTVRKLAVEAIHSNKVLQITYVDYHRDATVRLIEPIVLRAPDYLEAYCRLRSGWRTFRLSRMSSILILDETFSPRPHPPFRRHSFSVPSGYAAQVVPTPVVPPSLFDKLQEFRHAHSHTIDKIVFLSLFLGPSVVFIVRWVIKHLWN